MLAVVLCMVSDIVLIVLGVLGVARLGGLSGAWKTAMVGGGAVFWLGHRLRKPSIWRALDGLVALMMWGTAFGLFWGLAVH